MPRREPGSGVRDGEAAWAPSPPFATKRLRESRKGSRQWVLHRHDPVTYPAPERPRWIDVDRHGEPLPRPLWTFQNIVFLELDQAGRCRTEVVAAGPPAATASTSKDAPRHRHGQRVEPLADQSRWRSGSTGLVPLAADTPKDDAGHFDDAPGPKDATTGEVTPPPSATLFSVAAVTAKQHEPSSDRLDTAFEQFLRQFRGPAAAYLGGYAAWFAARLDHGRDRQGAPPGVTSDPRLST